VLEFQAGGYLGAVTCLRDLSRHLDPAVCAEAQVHMGACYEKLDAAEAEKIFRQVVDNYSDQAEAVIAAKDRLAVLARTRTATPSSANDLVFTPALGAGGADLSRWKVHRLR
jgi:hypothetical protein